MAWKTRRIQFDDVPLSEIISTLASVYHVNIKLADPGPGNCRITATFDNQPVTSVLNVIRSTLDLQIHNQGNTYLLSGKPCN
jgi:ferric-dicitrate binding protein FerR (iron transport regulator)